MLPRVVGYIRVSTEDQNLGAEAQRAAIKRWAQHNGRRVAAWHQDIGVSGATPLDRRPALMQALASLTRKRAIALVVAKRDRLARDVIIAGMVERLVEKAGAEILSVDGAGVGMGPEAQLMRRIVDSFAEYERALIAARTKAALAELRRKGVAAGCVPFGQRADERGRLQPNPDEIRARARILELRQERQGYGTITAALEREQFRTRAGKPYRQNQIVRIIRRDQQGRERAAAERQLKLERESRHIAYCERYGRVPKCRRTPDHEPILAQMAIERARQQEDVEEPEELEVAS